MPRAIVGLSIATLLCVLTAGIGGLVALAVSIGLMAAMARLMLLRVPGLTGDTYGAIAESVQLLVLLSGPLVLAL
jgi:adenosylcobinamide-GDP ribazoletransferase